MRRTLTLLAIFIAFVAIYTLSRHIVHSTTTTTTTTTTSAAHSTTTTTTTTTSATCLGQNFTGTYNTGQGAAGTVYATVTLTNTGAVSCTVRGWPILTLQDKLGAVLSISPVEVPSSGNGFQFLSGAAPQLTSQANKAPTTLTLATNDTTTFALAYSDVPVGTQACDNATSVDVQFAKDGTPVSMIPSEPVQPCNASEIWLSPFY
ncbi:MAG: DUF4232 domain-containing protein [Acidimicrobiales bacterium]